MRKPFHFLNALFLPTSLVLSMALVGCTDKPAENDTNVDKTALNETALGETTDTKDTTTNDVPPTSKVAKGSATLATEQAIVINNGAEPESLDPHIIQGVVEDNIVRQMLVGLLTTDPTGKLVAGMAKSWDSADNKIWTFKLRDAKWSNGDPVTAEDFVYSYRRLIDPETASPNASYFSNVKVANADAIIAGEADPETLGVTAIDDKTLTFTLSEPVPYFPDTLIHFATKPVHQTTVEEFGDKWTDPDNIVVNGPYKVSSWRVNDSIVLTRNSNYYDDDNTTIDTITLLPIASETSIISRYKAGEIDVSPGSIPAEQFEALKAELGDEVKVSPSLCTYYYTYNTTKPPFDDARVRRALSLALDRDTITDKVLGMGQVPAYQFTPTKTNHMINNTPEWVGWDKAQRVEEAKKLLNEAGYNEDNPLNFELLYNTSESHKKIAVAIDSLLDEALGIVNVGLINKEWKTYLDTMESGDFEVSRQAWCGGYNEPSTFLSIFKTGNSHNTSQYSNAKFDDIMESTLKTGVTDEQRAELYRQAEAQIDSDAPILPIYYYVDARLVKPYVIDFPVQDPLASWQIKDVAIAEH